MRWDYNMSLYLWEICCGDGRTLYLQLVQYSVHRLFLPLWLLNVLCYSFNLNVMCFRYIFACCMVMKNHLSLSEIKILVFKRVYLILPPRNLLNCSYNALWYFMCLCHSALDSHAQKSLRCRRSGALSIGICGFSRPNWVTSPVLWRIFKFAVKTRRRWMWLCL
jgi:hypothetical protein